MTTQQNPSLPSNDWRIFGNQESGYFVTNDIEYYYFETYEFASSCLKVFMMHNKPNYWHPIIGDGLKGCTITLSNGYWTSNKMYLEKDFGWIATLFLVLFGFDSHITTSRIERILEIKTKINSTWNKILWGWN